MPRTKAFDRAATLQKAIAIFCAKGYAAAGTDELMAAMNISRQSMYDTYGDKRALYLEAFRTYVSTSINEQIAHLQQSVAPLAGIEQMLITFALKTEFNGIVGCMGINAICEFGESDPELTAISTAEGTRLNRALLQSLRKAQTAKEISSAIKLSEAANFIQATLAGMKLFAKSGATKPQLKSLAHFALRSLTNPS